MGTLHHVLLFFTVIVLYSLASLAFPAGGAWYASLAKPDGTPPDYVLGTVWFLLHALIAASVVLSVRRRQMNRELLLLYGINWFFHQLFPLLFYGLQLPFLAAVDTLLILYSTWVLIRAIRPLDKIASSLLIPYLQWSVFAIYLAVSFWVLNL
ncbi:TspO/MBR family protein [Brevibacillus parabrevis]|uniref:TspO/MBR family protein n=1 Tax=Brevibacillus parabrevis TaxID=54914 RepID=UPI002E1DC7FF|nr:tryptophan-rich sensory protein [Brevibacillus parabrevis]